eukprot:gb/GECG01002089.1/.p1 GENE.gb/GECG01002089.1/~~gb/GECG01002089.1/.p1  ORF type:complete len:978 (+),score=136.58 gb/GECG01002089.1/:1-2934(+)
MASRKFRNLFNRQHQQPQHHRGDGTTTTTTAVYSGTTEQEAVVSRENMEEEEEPQEPYSPSHTLGFNTKEMTREDLIKALESTSAARDDAVRLLKTASEENGTGTLLADMKGELDQWRQEAGHLICQQSNAHDQEPRLTMVLKPEDLRTVQLRLDQCRASISDLETRLCNNQETIDSLRKTVNTLQIQNSALRADNNYLRTKVVRSSSRRSAATREMPGTIGSTRNRASSTEQSAHPKQQYFSLPQLEREKERRSSMDSARPQFVHTLKNELGEDAALQQERSAENSSNVATRRSSTCSTSSDIDSCSGKEIDVRSGNVPAQAQLDLSTSPISSFAEQDTYRPSFDGRESLDFSLDEWAEFSSASTVCPKEQTFDAAAKTAETSQAVGNGAVSVSAEPQKLSVKPPAPSKGNHRRVRSDMVYRQQSGGWNLSLNGGVCDSLEQIAEEASLGPEGSASNPSTDIEGSPSKSSEFQFSPMGQRYHSRKHGKALDPIFRNIPLFNSLDRTEQTILANRFEMRRYSDQDCVHCADDPAGNFFVVVEGCVTALPGLSRDTFSEQDMSQTRRFTEGDYFLGEEIQDGQAIARGESSCLLLPSGVLTQVLEWFANARRMSDMVEEANLKTNPQQQQMISSMQTELQNAREFKTLQSVLRRHSSTARAIPLSKSKKDDTVAFYYQLQQANTDLIREESVLLNGCSFKLGSQERLNSFFAALKETLSQKLSSIVNVENFARVGVFSDGEQVIQSILENLTNTVIVSACRTEAGGASYAHCLKLLGNNPHINLTSDSSSSSPTDIVIQEGYIQIQSENMYRLLWSRHRHEETFPAEDEDATPLCGLLRAVSTETITIHPLREAEATPHSQECSQGQEGGKLSKLFLSRGKKKRNTLMAPRSSHDIPLSREGTLDGDSGEVNAFSKKPKGGIWTTLLNRKGRSRDTKANQNQADPGALSTMNQQEEDCQRFVDRYFERYLRILCKPVE